MEGVDSGGDEERAEQAETDESTANGMGGGTVTRTQRERIDQ